MVLHQENMGKIRCIREIYDANSYYTLTIAGLDNAAYSCKRVCLETSFDMMNIRRSPKVDFMSGMSTESIGLALDSSLEIAFLCSAIVSRFSIVEGEPPTGYLRKIHSFTLSFGTDESIESSKRHFPFYDHY